MKKGFLTVVFLLMAGLAWAHPGGLDENGGHRCLTDCEKYGLKPGEYHYHKTPPPKQEAVPTAMPEKQVEQQTIEPQKTTKPPVTPPVKAEKSGFAGKLFWGLFLAHLVAVPTATLGGLWKVIKKTAKKLKPNGNNLQAWEIWVGCVQECFRPPHSEDFEGRRRKGRQNPEKAL
eukprot:TRINITY_DN7248_c0_g1_i2.p2 TRINITY_DN7248_c0_g1~~TRINITY_DN7248_c0_g1_i2.p2  ORF type:complete len:174 (-),score=22.39 TRINITY_DN7248_c0_g1_i2:441-962(-)